MNSDQIEQARKEAGRWIILQTTGLGTHIGVTEEMIMPVLRSSWLGASREFLRTQIDYLESRKLVETERPAFKPWRVKLTRHGHDIVDYVKDCEPGIDRPVKYWGGGE